MLPTLIYDSLIVFAITLILTKSTILGAKREFVKQRYEASKQFSSPWLIKWIHCWWHALWICPMCSGWWITMVIVFLIPIYRYSLDVLAVFGLNWLLHCLENYWFQLGKEKS